MSLMIILNIFLRKKLRRCYRLNMKRKKKQNNKLSDKEKLLNNFKIMEEYRTKRIENDILNKAYKEINDFWELKQIANDAYVRYKNGGKYE